MKNEKWQMTKKDRKKRDKNSSEKRKNRLISF